MADVTDTFRKYIEKALFGPDTCIRIELVIMGNDQNKSASGVVQTWKIDDAARYSVNDELDELVTTIVAIGQQDADGWGGTTQYCIRAKFSDNLVGRSPIVRMHGRLDDNADTTGGEPPTALGLTQAAMRHAEFAFKLMAQQTDAISRHSAEAISSLASSNRQFEKDRMSMFTAFEEVMGRKHERDLEIRKEERRDKQIAKVVESLTPILGPVAGKFLLGPKAPTEVKNDPAMVGLREFVKSLSAEEMAAIQQALGNKTIALFEILQRVTPEESESSDDTTEKPASDDSKQTIENPWH